MERLSKPQVVIDAIAKYYQEINANIYRGVHTLKLATDAYEISRGKIKITLMLNICMNFFYFRDYIWN
jgi:selenocysteine lyase/cysteine desulfurase